MKNRIIENSYSEPAPSSIDLGRYNALNQSERDFVDKQGMRKELKNASSEESPIKDLLPWVIAPIIGTVALKKLRRLVESSMFKAKRSLLINALRQTFLALDAFGAKAKDRELWFLHMLTLATAESGLNPQAVNNTIVHYEGKRLKSFTYGLLQQTKSNWNSSTLVVRRFIPVLSTLPTIQLVSKTLGLTPGQLLTPSNQLGPNTPDMYQVGPNVGALFNIKNYIDEHFHYYKGSWIALTQEIAGSRNWYNITINPKLKPILKDFYLGRQLIVTLLHVNGFGFYKAKQLYHTDRLQTDPLIFNQLLNEDTKWDFLPNGDIKPPAKALGAGVTSGFYRKSGAYHGGFDVHAPKGTNIYAVNDGIVTFAGWQNASNKKEGYGRYVEIKHPDGYVTRYAHLDSFNVKKNDFVTSGTKIGESDNSGHVTSGNAHLHYEIVKNGKRLDPNEYLNTNYDYKRTVSPFYILLTDVDNNKKRNSVHVDLTQIKI